MRIAVIIPVKTFSKAKTRLELTHNKKIDICKLMLEEILQTLSISPQIAQIVVVTKDKDALKICEKFQVTTIPDKKENGVNSAVSIADKYLLENNFDASIVLPQDIPYIKTQDIDFMLKFHSPPNFVIVVPSRKFDGTNALVRMPINLMSTHYDDDSYRNHMKIAKESTRNVALVFVKRIMWDIDDMEDLDFILQQNEKPQFLEKLKNILG